ncbi:hypothetical protein CIB48_g5591 [Xylaria polymorpha]|nr:hypothetical protein CIB48_g5591 [Xylaria polymorpha]
MRGWYSPGTVEVVIGPIDHGPSRMPLQLALVLGIPGAGRDYANTTITRHIVTTLLPKLDAKGCSTYPTLEPFDSLPNTVFVSTQSSNMQLFATIMGAALIASGVSAQKAVVKNNCQSTIYVQSFPYDGSAAGTLTTVAPRKTVKIATTKTLTGPLFFGYSFSANPDYAYYELSSEWGNPFAASHNTLTPGSGCMVFDCAAGQASCYSTPAQKKVFGCPQPVNLTATVCA